VGIRPWGIGGCLRPRATSTHAAEQPAPAEPAGLPISHFNTGNRFIVDLENGKPTVQLQRVLDLMDLLGLEVVVRGKAARSL